MDMPKNVDILFISMLSNKENKVKLDKLYEKYKFEAYRMMKDSELKNVNFVKNATIEKSIAFNKAIGLLELLKKYGSENNKSKNSLDLEITDVVFTGYSKILEGIKKRDINFLEKDFIKTQSLKHSHLYWQMSSMVYLFFRNEAEIYFDIEMEETILGLFDSFTKDVSEKFKTTDPQAASLRNKYFPNKKFEDFYTLCQIIESTDELKFQDFATMLHIVAQLNNIDIENISIEHMITRSDLNRIFSVIHNQEIPKDIHPHAVWTCIVVTLLGKEINKSKELFFKNNEEITDLEKKIEVINSKDIKSVKSNLEKIIEEKEKEISRLKKDYRTGLEKEILDLKKEIADKDLIIEDLENIIDAAADEEDEKLSPVEYRDMKKNLDFIENEKVYIIGGHSKLINKLKTNFPNLVLLDKNYNMDQKENVFLLTRFITHTTSDKIKSLNMSFKYIDEKSHMRIALKIKELLIKE